MRAVTQRVTSSRVVVNGQVVGEIGQGLNILLGVKKGDNEADAQWLVEKIANLRIFQDEQGKMNLSLVDIGGSALVISQFTLAGSVQRGRRPSFDTSAEPERAKELYEYFVTLMSEHVTVQTGEFGAMMDVAIHNDGPVTFVIDSPEPT